MLFRSRDQPAAAASGAQFVALNASLRVNAALRVDRLLGLRDATQLQPVGGEAASAQPGFAGARWRDAQGRVWQALDLVALATDARFLDVADAESP